MSIVQFKPYLYGVLLALFTGPVETSQSGASQIIFKENLFVNGQGGYAVYRIPVIVTANDGTILVFCEGRKNGHQDTGDIDLLMKRSFDHGKTWTEHVIIHEEGGEKEITIGNPVPIVDNESGRIHLLFAKDYHQLYHVHSDDAGKTWTEPREYTHILEGFDYPLVLIAPGPVHGIQLSTGRLIAPVWVCDREREDRYDDLTDQRMRAGVLYSDDNGQSWHAGGLLPPSDHLTHEATVIERKDGSLLINTRTYQRLYRAEAFSYDGGETWSEPTLNEQLPDPTCQASMLGLDDGHFLFLNPAVKSLGGSEHRKNLTLKISQDQGKSWSDNIVIEAGRAGYSDMAITKDGMLVAVFETGERVYREKIRFVSISLSK